MRRPPGEDLDALWGGPAAPDSVLAVFELVGFHPYHDSFGALAGAAMLERLYGRLARRCGRGDAPTGSSPTASLCWRPSASGGPTPSSPLPTRR